LQDNLVQAAGVLNPPKRHGGDVAQLPPVKLQGFPRPAQVALQVGQVQTLLFHQDAGIDFIKFVLFRLGHGEVGRMLAFISPDI